MRRSPSLLITWGPGGSAWPLPLSLGLQVWTNYLSVAESDQLGILVDTTNCGTVYVQIGWAAANEAGEIIGPTNSTPGVFYESVESPGALTSEFTDTFQRYSLYPKEWGPIPANRIRTIWVPTATPYFRLCLWVDTPPGSNDVCKTVVMLSSLDEAIGTAK